MPIFVNGVEMSIEPGTTLTGLLAQTGLSPDAVVVELNTEIVDTAAYDATGIKNGDKIEILRFVGGG